MPKIGEKTLNLAAAICLHSRGLPPFAIFQHPENIEIQHSDEQTENNSPAEKKTVSVKLQAALQNRLLSDSLEGTEHYPPWLAQLLSLDRDTQVNGGKHHTIINLACSDYFI